MIRTLSSLESRGSPTMESRASGRLNLAAIMLFTGALVCKSVSLYTGGAGDAKGSLNCSYGNGVGLWIFSVQASEYSRSNWRCPDMKTHGTSEYTVVPAQPPIRQIPSETQHVPIV